MEVNKALMQWNAIAILLATSCFRFSLWIVLLMTLTGEVSMFRTESQDRDGMTTTPNRTSKTHRADPRPWQEFQERSGFLPRSIVPFSFSFRKGPEAEHFRGSGQEKEIVFPGGKRHRLTTGHELIATAAALIDHAVPVRGRLFT